MAEPTRLSHDVFIIGGGINGCGIARDAAGRGYDVCVAEMNDLGSGTSSGSTKLIHGGLRYLEHYEFRLVREALKEREVLWKIAPHIISPMRFILPHHRGLRPAWLLRLGLFLYDHIGGRKKLPATQVLDLTTDAAGGPLNGSWRKAFEFSDCWVDDARLVVLNAMDARDKGAVILPRTKVISAKPDGAEWTVKTRCMQTGAETVHHARMLINAGGPWVDAVIGNALHQNEPGNVRLVQGSHIVINKKFEHDRAYFFQNEDGRIFFAIPYEDDFTLIGTTDRDYKGDISNIEISEPEIDYLCEGASNYFREPVAPDDIVWSFSAVRPLYDDGASKAQEATRDYVLKREAIGDAPMVNIFGGKITTYRRLSESVLGLIEEDLGARGDTWTASAPLPGGEFDMEDRDGEAERLRARYGFLSQHDAKRFLRLYGKRAYDVIGLSKRAEDMGRRFGGNLTEREVDYLIDQEWATTSDDVLWRRTKDGLRFSKSERASLDAYMETARAEERVLSTV